MRVLTWNMGHRGPGIRRGDPQEQWTFVAQQSPDVILAQEAPAPEFVDFAGYDIAFVPVSARHIGHVVAVKQASGTLPSTVVSTDRDDLAVWGELAGVGRALLVSTQVKGHRNPIHAVDRALALAGGEPVLLGGDFNAGPSVGSHDPCKYAPSVGLLELSTSSPETNTVRGPRQTGVRQVDHLFGRGFPAPGRMQVLPVTEDDGPVWSYHNVMIVDLEQGD